ncbi:MAG: hypothetical protein LBH95_02065 [Oscillospiraceae bacterium]|nr:hypothetical protein [Oscillospiraceae bacterium]
MNVIPDSFIIANGNLTGVTDSTGNTTVYTYDKLNRLESETDAAGNVTRYEHDGNGNLVKITQPNGGETVLGYDRNDRLISYTDAEGFSFISAYDKNGNTVTNTDGNGNTWSYVYDVMDRLLSTTDPMGGVTRYSYDILGRLVKVTSPSGLEITSGYDSVNSVTGMTDAMGYTTGYTYDNMNRVTRIDYPDGTFVTYTYDTLGNLVKEQIANKGNEYWYDSLNRQVRKLEDGKDTYTYIYDRRGNLIEGVYEKNKNQRTVIERYTYDAAGRMVKGVNEQGESSEYIYNGLGLLAANEWSIKKNAYGYNGRTSVRKDFVLDYTSVLKHTIMEQESGGDGLTYRYTYGLDKVSAAVLGIPNGAGSVTQSYPYPDGRKNIVKLWYHHDHSGSTDFLTDNVSGKVTGYITYDDWGMPTAKAVLKVGARELDLAAEYAGYSYDPVLRLYYARARMYDAEDRRFTSADPVKGDIAHPQTMTPYTYCLNNPVRYTDPAGLASQWDKDNLTAEDLAAVRAYGEAWNKANQAGDEAGKAAAHAAAEAIRNGYRTGTEHGTGDGNTVGIPAPKIPEQTVSEARQTFYEIVEQYYPGYSQESIWEEVFTAAVGKATLNPDGKVYLYGVDWRSALEYALYPKGLPKPGYDPLSLSPHPVYMQLANTMPSVQMDYYYFGTTTEIISEKKSIAISPWLTGYIGTPDRTGGTSITDLKTAERYRERRKLKRSRLPSGKTKQNSITVKME